MSDEFAEAFDVIALHTGVVLETHPSARCEGEPCCIHNPSPHHMVSWPLHWRADRQIMERLCEHSVGHPDPDDVHVRASRYEAVHGCDGCCSVAPAP